MHESLPDLALARTGTVCRDGGVNTRLKAGRSKAGFTL